MKFKGFENVNVLRFKYLKILDVLNLDVFKIKGFEGDILFLDYLKKYEKNSLIVNIVMIVVSILLIINPAGVLNVVMIIFGLGVLIDGVFRIVSYIKSNKDSIIYTSDLIEGVLIILAGLGILICKKLLISISPLVIGIWIIIRSILKIQIAYNLKGANSDKWLFVLISAIVTLILGIFVIANPFEMALAVTIVAGIILLVSSILDLMESLTILNIIK